MERKTHTMLTQLPPASRPPVIVRSSILSKAMRQLLLLATTVVLVLSLIAFVMVRSLVLHRMLAETSSVAAATEELMEARISMARLHASLLAAHPIIRAAVAGQTEEFAAFAGTVRDQHASMRGFTVLDADGGTQASWGDAAAVRDGAKPSLTLVTGDGCEAYDIVIPKIGRASCRERV